MIRRPRRPRGPEPVYVKPFNPLDYANLTKNVVEELMRQPAAPLPLERAFIGAGVYALFYIGADPDYAPFRSPEADVPIYVGKAAPAGARKGVATNLVTKTELYKRLSEHTASINAAENLSLEDFRCRYLVVEPLWIAMAESFLITNFKPLWNLKLDGFGNHNPGKGRFQGEIPLWDVHHPGRPWVKNFKQGRTREDSLKAIAEFTRIQRERPDLLALMAEDAAAAEAGTDGTAESPESDV